VDRTQTWVLVVSAFVLGLALGAVAMVGAWRSSASRGDEANAARALAARRLHDAQARSAVLSRRLHRTRTSLSAALAREKRLKVELRGAERQAAASGQQAAGEQRELLTLRHRASTVTSDVAALEAYVRATPTRALDSGFLQSQLSYIYAAARRLQNR
jgi:hypothetical protein